MKEKNKFLYIIIVSVIILLSGLVIGLDPINVNEKIFTKDSYYGSVTIKNSFTKTIKLYAILEENTDHCYSHCSALKNITIYERSVLIDDIKFDKIILSNTREIDIPYTIYIKSSEKWLEYSIGTELPAGNYLVRLEATKKPEDTIDWVIKSQGVWITEWAIWYGSSPDVYYRFENDGTDETGLADLTLNSDNTFNSTSYKIGSFARSYNSDANTGDNSTYTANFGLENFTIAYWINTTDSTGESAIISNDPELWGAGAYPDSWAVNLVDTTGEARFINGASGGAAVVTSTTAVNDGKWHRVVVVREGIGSNKIKIYVDGVNEANATNSRSYENGTALYIGGVHTSNSGLVGTLDDIVIFNGTAWNSSDVLTDYNSGNGNNVSIRQKVILEYPTDNQEISLSRIIFNCSGAAESGRVMSNVSLWSNFSGSWLKLNETVGLTKQIESISITGGVDISEYDFEWNCEFCENDGLCTFSESNSTVKMQYIVDEYEIYNENTTEGSSESFIINVTYDSSVYDYITANLIYNGTRYSSNRIGSGNNIIFNSSIDIPTVATGESQINTFFWELLLTDGATTTNINVSSHNQNVSIIHLELCDATYNVQALNFSSWNEEDSTRINPFYFAGNFEIWSGKGTVRRSVSFLNLSTDEINLCIFPSDKTYSINGDIEYNSQINGTDYNTRNYYFQGDTINNQSQDIKLYLLSSDSSTSFILKVQDINLLPISNALILIQRYNVGTGEFNTVSIAKTDDNGQTIGFFKTETIDYRFIIIKDSVVLLQTSGQKVIPETSPYTLTFTVGIDEIIPWSLFEDLENLTSSLSYNNNTRNVTFSYIDTSGSFSLSRLILQKDNSSSSSQIVCNINSTSSTATLSCSTENIIGTYTASGYITRNGQEYLVEQITFKIDDLSAAAGLLGVFLAWFIILISAFAFKFNEIAGIILVNAAVILVNIIGLVNFGYLYIFGLIGISVIIMVVLER